MNGFVDTESIVLLGISLAIGLLIGVERGWKSRQIKDGGRIAGLRTYGLTGLLGGVAGVLSQYLGVMVFGFVFLGFTAAVTVAYVMQQRVSGDVSITSLVTMLLTFMLGALATLDHVNLAASSANGEGGAGTFYWWPGFGNKSFSSLVCCRGCGFDYRLVSLK